TPSKLTPAPLFSFFPYTTLFRSNPNVVEEMLGVVRYWLDMGVDALRVDAIPYLVERDGTNCENLPETHLLIKKVRQEIDRSFERSEEHTSELQSPDHLVCRLLLE